MGFADPVARHVVLRQVDTPLGVIELDVLPEVDELQRRADRVGLPDISLSRSFEKVQQKTSDRIRRAATVMRKLCEIGIALLRDVLAERLEQVFEKLERQRVLAHDLRYVGEQWRARRFTGSDAIKLSAVDA